jgi:hypothetical protein
MYSGSGYRAPRFVPRFVGSQIAEQGAIRLGVVPPRSRELGRYNLLPWPLRPFIAR